MWPFAKKAKDLRELPSVLTEDSKWTVANAVHDGALLSVRYNQSAKAWCAHSGLPIKLGFAIPLNEPNTGGLPSPAEYAQLGAIEDQIFRSVDGTTVAMPALVLTTGTMMELVFYIPAGVDIKALHESISAAVSTHEVQCEAVVDARWDAYRQFAG